MKIYYVEENEVRYVLFEKNGKVKISEPDAFGKVEGVDLWDENVIYNLHLFFRDNDVKSFEDLDLFTMNIEFDDLVADIFYIGETY